MPNIHYQKEGRLAWITMEGDDDLNIGVANEELAQRLIEYRDDAEAWCCVITGAGNRAFSAGANLKTVGQSGWARAGFWDPRPPNPVTGIECWKPVIAAINGHCIGAGLMLALACDIRIASENATFSLPEVKYGFPPSAGATRLPRAIPLGPALEMLMTGDRITAQEAYHWGLVNRVVPLPDLHPAARHMADRILANPPLAVRAVKELALRGLDMTVEQSLRLAGSFSFIARQTEDAREGPKAFVEKRRPVFKGR